MGFPPPFLIPRAVEEAVVVKEWTELRLAVGTRRKDERGATRSPTIRSEAYLRGMIINRLL